MSFSVGAALALVKRLQHPALLGFVCPEDVKVGDVSLRELLTAIRRNDEQTLASFRPREEGQAVAFDALVGGVRHLVKRDFRAASLEFARVDAANWKVAASLLGAIALAAAGEVRQAIALANQSGDFIRNSGVPGSTTYRGDRAMLAEAVRCIQRVEARYPVPTGPPQIESPLRYLVGYPRSGNSLLVQFLSYTFRTRHYSVYPGDGWYFSRRFYERAPGHPIFIKDHVLRPEYLNHEILSPIRDGRNSIISLGRYLHAGGTNQLVRRNELADFISHVAQHLTYGFWGDHTRRLLEAREKGAQIRVLRYEEFFGSYEPLLALAQQLAGPEAVPNVDESGYLAYLEQRKRRLSLNTHWAPGLALPEDSFIPQNWSIGGNTIDWRRSFDARARRRFHDLGGTEMLIQLGYETDENWWRRE
jgi:hypothetical protein